MEHDDGRHECRPYLRQAQVRDRFIAPVSVSPFEEPAEMDAHSFETLFSYDAQGRPSGIVASADDGSEPVSLSMQWSGARLTGLDGVGSRALSQSFGYDGVYQVSAQSQLDGVAWLGTQTSRDAGGRASERAWQVSEQALLGLEQVWYGPSASGGHASSRPSAGCVAGARSVPESERIQIDDRRVGMQSLTIGGWNSNDDVRRSVEGSTHRF